MAQAARASGHDIQNSTASVPTTVARLLRTSGSVSSTAQRIWATSSETREVISPARVVVKKRSDWLCKWQNSRLRRSDEDALADAHGQILLSEADEAGRQRQQHQADDVEQQWIGRVGRLAGGDGVVDQAAHQQRRRQVEQTADEDGQAGQQHDPAVGPETRQRLAPEPAVEHRGRRRFVGGGPGPVSHTFMIRARRTARRQPNHPFCHIDAKSIDIATDM